MKMREYTVRAGDTLSELGQIFQIPWQQLYDLPENAAFRKLRPDPNFIVDGDVLFVPDRSLEILRHALGLASFICEKSKIPKGLGTSTKYSRRWKKPNRNYYHSSHGDLECQHLVAQGFMTESQLNAAWTEGSLYRVTDVGQEEALKGLVFKRRWGYDQ